jgi:hypothetical protein
MKVELTKSQIRNLADFIQFNFIDSIRQDDGIDNINYLVDMCDAYKVLRKAENQTEDSKDTDETIESLKEKLEHAKEDIRKLLSGSCFADCTICIHDENEEAGCRKTDGSDSWCCKNARWNEH